MPEPRFLARRHLASLLAALRQHGYRTVGPQVVDGAILYRPLDDVAALPHGIRDEQQPGRYELTPRDDARCFAWANGPQGLKPLTFAAEEPLWQAQRDVSGAIAFSAAEVAAPPTAVVGVRSCDLAALKLHDAHFLDGVTRDAPYAARRAALFIVAVNCSHPAATCFCASSGDGPSCHDGYDLLLDELDEGFVVQSGSRGGEALLAQLPLQPLVASHRAAVEAQQRAAANQSRQLPSRNLRAALFSALDHPHWQDIAERCLACGNCTAVCPTCFCHSEHDDAALSGEVSHHLRRWDSCFTAGHSYIHGLVIRAETGDRYRQWLTHKLGSWHEQYGRSGCVGCGRCIAWCPVGIDLTAEVIALCGEGAP